MELNEMEVDLELGAPTQEQPLLEKIGLTGEGVKVLIMVQELAILDKYADQLAEQLKAVKNLGNLMTSAVIEHEDFIDVQNAKVRISEELIGEVRAKVDEYLKETVPVENTIIGYPVMAYRKENWFANMTVGDVKDFSLVINAIDVTKADDPTELASWKGLLEERINASSLKSFVNKQYVQKLLAENPQTIVTKEMVSESLPAYAKDFVKIDRAYDIVTVKATGKN